MKKTIINPVNRSENKHEIMNIITTFSILTKQKYHRLVLVLAITLTNSFCFAQDDVTQIKKNISTMFEGMATFDTALIRSVFDDNLMLKTITTERNGKTNVRNQSAQHFLNSVGFKKENTKYDERITSMDIKIDKDMAMVWAPYRFYLNDAFSHCGVNLFALAKLDGMWKIISITDTRRKSDCVP